MRILKVIGLLLEYPDELLWENRDDALALAKSPLTSDSVTKQVAGEKRDDTRQALDAVWEEEQVKFIEDNATACDSSSMQAYQRRFRCGAAVR